MFTMVEENFEFRGSDMVQNEGNKQEKNWWERMCEIPDKYRQKSHKIQKIQTDPDKSRQFQTFWEIQTIPDAVGTL